MSTSSADATNEAMSKEEAGQCELHVRNICLHGTQSRSYNEIQETVDSCLLPNIDWILACPKTNYFAEKIPIEAVISWALMNKCYPLLHYLIHNGWDMNRQRLYNLGCPSWLGEVCVLQDVEFTRWLLDHGMDPRIGSTTPKLPRQPAHYRGSKGWPLYQASIYGSLEIFKLLQERGANLEYAHALHGAAYGGLSQIPIIRHLLDNRYLDVNELDIYHLPHTGTPLLAAILKGDVEVVRVLLDYGANPHACIKSPYEATTTSAAQALACRNEEASNAILIMLKEATVKWEGDPADAPVSRVF